MQRNPTVFIVDDDKAVRESVSALLRAHNMSVELFSSGEDFLAAYHPGRLGCILQDVKMNGGMNGLQLQEVLIERGCKLPTVVISGQPDEKMAAAALANGALAVLYKPVPYKELLIQIRRAFEIDAARRQLPGS